jgi:ribonuclease P protein component
VRSRQRLTKRSQFLFVLRRGQSWATPLVTLRAVPNSLPDSRFGFSVGRTVGGAVVRNRIKRRLREIARKAPVQTGWDLVVTARPAAARADFHALRASLEGVLRTAALLPPPAPPQRKAP